MFVLFTPDIPMQANCQAWMVTAHRDRLGHSSTSHHKASTGDNATRMALQDTAVNASGRPKVIRIDNEVSPHFMLLITLIESIRHAPLSQAPWRIKKSARRRRHRASCHGGFPQPQGGSLY